MLRQDPDVVMVGEVRDAETATQAVQAALTGHLVLTTLHTNDTVGAIARLRDLGVPSFLVAATLTGVVAQRLVRQVCPSCAADVPLTADEVHALGVPHPEDYAGRLVARRGQGCAKCRYTGYYGRTGIFEVLGVNPRLRHLIAEGATPEVLHAHGAAGRAALAARARRPQGGRGRDLLRGGHARHRGRGGDA